MQSSLYKFYLIKRTGILQKYLSLKLVQFSICISQLTIVSQIPSLRQQPVLLGKLIQLQQFCRCLFHLFFKQCIQLFHRFPAATCRLSHHIVIDQSRLCSSSSKLESFDKRARLVPPSSHTSRFVINFISLRLRRISPVFTRGKALWISAAFLRFALIQSEG